MDALILSCSTGGGHNAAGKAIGEELQKRGHDVKTWDPYELVSSNLANRIGNVYIKIAQRVPWLFGIMYFLGEIYRKLPFRSPVYFVNRRIAKLLKSYLEQHPVDVIIMPHLFPAEVITYMKDHGMKVPMTLFIATDYACIPFTEETNCDYYAIPGKELMGEFVNKGIPENKLLPVGIPVSTKFIEDISREEAKRQLGLSAQKHYILVSGGSMGAGRLEQAIGIICNYMEKRKDTECIVICGNNSHLYEKLSKKKLGRLHVLKSTQKMHLYMKASDVFLSKPGGLSSTEAAAAGSFLIHFSPIPGCELANRKFFECHHMCIAVRNMKRQLIPALQSAYRQQAAARMNMAQKKYVNGHACQEICDWLEENIKAYFFPD